MTHPEPVAGAQGETVLKLSGITKSFGPVRVLTGVDFDLKAGEVHALAGENGAGKSTLMNIIDGIHRPDGGRVELFGEAVHLSGPAEAQARGIGFVHQEIALCPDISIAENIFMAAPHARGRWFLNRRELRRKAEAVLGLLHPMPVDTLVGQIGISAQQLVEIAKALTLDCRILILDEPTAALTEAETRRLFDVIRTLKARGIAIIYISHRMAEIFEICDRITVLRDGRKVVTKAIVDTTPEEVAERMVGRELGDLYPEKPGVPAGAPVLLQVEGLADADDHIADIAFDLKAGEILGLAGLMGAGRSEIAQTVCGLRHRAAGRVVVEGHEVRIPDYRGATKQGLAYLSEDRKGAGVFLDMSIAANVSAQDPGRVAGRLGMIDGRAEAAQAAEFGRRMSLRMAGPGQKVSELSGGNQQKVALARMLSVNPRVVFLDEPTRGVDVGAKSEIHAILRELSEAGVGVVVISSELPELIGLSDRILVLHEGRISGEIANQQDMTEEAIIHLASGLGVARAPQLEGEPA
ncbi:MAG TPA: D-xylose ABC transporter ATP-binding protein [Tistrella mobilis]|uniref:D-xylose ABC transporter ATP-binding protein n=1 Tax=Tistrella mobilis TaxID=171437 RepID=A0A3B9IP49_9PROT|nr:D-xylose ABC transporter ATP-binding protein [Tistrella mobilis]